MLECKRRENVAFVKYFDKVTSKTVRVVDGRKERHKSAEVKKKDKLGTLRWFKTVFEEVDTWQVISIKKNITNLARYRATHDRLAMLVLGTIETPLVRVF